MENKLKQLFDFQRFQKNEHLAHVIAETENCYNSELCDEDLSFVSAAGEAFYKQHREDNGDAID